MSSNGIRPRSKPPCRES